MITAQRNGKYITRNASHFKRIDSSLQKDTNTEDREEDDDDLVSTPEDRRIEIHGATPSSTNNPPAQSNTRRSVRDRKRVNRYGQNIYEQ